MPGQDDPSRKVASPRQLPCMPPARTARREGHHGSPGFCLHPVQGPLVSKISLWVQPFHLPVHTGPGWGGPRPPPLDHRDIIHLCLCQRCWVGLWGNVRALCRNRGIPTISPGLLSNGTSGSFALRISKEVSLYFKKIISLGAPGWFSR